MVNAIDRAVLTAQLGAMARHIKPEHIEALAFALETGEPSARLIHDLTATQRAMIGARITHRPVGPRRSSLPSSGFALTNGAAATLLDIHPSLILNAKKLLAHGTPQEIERAQRGHGGVAAARKYYSRRSNEVGANPARLAREALSKRIWANLRRALEGLNELPNPQECVAIVRGRDRHGFVPRTLNPARRWLDEFTDAYNQAADHAKTDDQADDHKARGQTAA